MPGSFPVVVALVVPRDGKGHEAEAVVVALLVLVRKVFESGVLWELWLVIIDFGIFSSVAVNVAVLVF